MKVHKSRQQEIKKDLRQAKQGIVSGIILLAVLSFTHWLIVSLFSLNIPLWLIGVLYVFVSLSLFMDFAVVVRTKNKLN